MTLDALRDDALKSTDEGFILAIGLPWIRSLPLASLIDLSIVIDGVQIDGLAIEQHDRRVELSDLAAESEWWFIQDRLRVRGPRLLNPGTHSVELSFKLVIPYLQISADGPLMLPFRYERTLVQDAVAVAPLCHVVRREPAAAGAVSSLPDNWVIAASSFNWTPEVVLGARAAAEITAGIVADGVATTIEIEPGQTWRSYPEITSAEVDSLHSRLEAIGGHVSIVGGSLDNWTSPIRRRTDDERLDFLLPQVHAAGRLGATGIRLPLGYAGEPLLRRLLPSLQELNLVLFEEAQGLGSPGKADVDAAIETIARIDDPHLRLLIDTSMIMPAAPMTFLEKLRSAGVSESFVRLLETDWHEPAIPAAAAELLRAGGVPAHIDSLFVNLLTRFGRSHAEDLRDALPLVGAFHLKFWDLEDADQRVSSPLEDLGALLGASDFGGSLCSEWGGHDWLDEDPTAITRSHLGLARDALAIGVQRS